MLIGKKQLNLLRGIENNMSKEYYYSEIFSSMQGEGKYTGIPTAWVRLFGCSLECKGFGQINPKDPSSYRFDKINADDIKSIKDFPVVSTGCDSVYSVDKKYRHLNHKDTSENITELLINSITNEYNPDGEFKGRDLCFTGGEPLLKSGQNCIMEIIDHLKYNSPDGITIETNGTQELMNDFISQTLDSNVFMSVSPKLYSVSGEPSHKAIKPNVIKQYSKFYNGQLKFVCNGSKECWDEIETVIEKFKIVDCVWPIYIMPVGGTTEGQRGELKGHMSAGVIADEAIKRGYRVSARVHCYLWENEIGK